MGIVRNAAKCLICNTEIESTYRHHWVQCNCGNVFVDGGLDYVRRGVHDETQVQDLSVFSDGERDEELNKSGDQWTTSEVGL